MLNNGVFLGAVLLTLCSCTLYSVFTALFTLCRRCLCTTWVPLLSTKMTHGLNGARRGSQAARCRARRGSWKLQGRCFGSCEVQVYKCIDMLACDFKCSSHICIGQLCVWTYCCSCKWKSVATAPSCMPQKQGTLRPMQNCCGSYLIMPSSVM